jgi:hypothetical protein
MWSVLLIFLSFLCCVFALFVLVLCLVPNVACVCELSILDCPFGFSYLYLHINTI